jgi:hypothetical protein
MAEYSRLAKGKFTSTGFAQIVNLPFQPDYVTFLNYTVANAAASTQKVPQAFWDSNMGQGFAIQQVYTAAPALTFDTVTVNGISTFSAGLLNQFGPTQQVVASTKADPTSFEVTGHGFKSGDVVMFEGLYSTQYTAGLPQMSGIPYGLSPSPNPM